ncbi:MAG: hypothetical protein JJT76_14790 [Clostridiaceae bacterium]|nr:hypothetical protein [Clostridiaceae bacterium]
MERIEYLQLREPEGGYLNITGAIISAKEYSIDKVEVPNSNGSLVNKKVTASNKKNSFKTKFHLSESRGSKYSVFQLLNVEYLRNLRRYFYENLMLTELNTIAYYESNFFGILT